jgi:hypothetical protein
MTVRTPAAQPVRRAPAARTLVGRLALVSAAVIVAGACARGPAPATGARPSAAPADAGAASATAAVTGFVAAARVNDVRTMGLLFGTAAGPVSARDAAGDVEKRMRALACYLAHDAARVTDDLPAVAAGERRLVTVAIRQRELARETRFTVVPNARGRWFVESFDVERLSDFCRPS